MTWWDPTLEEIAAAYEDGGFDYDVKPSIRVLLGEIARLEERLSVAEDIAWVATLPPTVRLDYSRTIREQREEAEASRRKGQ